MEDLQSALQFNRNVSQKKLNTYLQQSQTNPIVGYLLGMYYEKNKNMTQAILLYENAIRLCPNFAEPRFQLTELTHLTDYLLPILNQPTFNPREGNRWNLLHQLRIVSTLIQASMAEKNIDKTIEYCNIVDIWCQRIHLVKKPDELYRLKEIGKNSYLTLGNMASGKGNMNEALEYYSKGLKLGKDVQLTSLDDLLYSGYQVCKDYIRIDSLEVKINDLPEKIHIGYIGPDFNKNAAGLFLTPFLKDYNSSQFEVYIYYTNTSNDPYTDLFKQYNVHWRNCGNQKDEDIYKQIEEDQLHVLVDLIACGHGGRPNLLRMKPSPIIISAIGYPGRSYLQGLDYFLTDKYCQPTDYCNIGERPFYFPDFFSCYSLFENEPLPIIEWEANPNSVRVGIFNRACKFSKEILNAWKHLLDKNPNWHFFIKYASDDFHDFPKDRIHYLNFKDTLADYFKQFDQIDFTLDTYPYSGTTTSCSSLMMGCPVLCMWSNENDHVKNVTGSLLKWCNLNEWVCSSLQEYASFKYSAYSISDRHYIRKRFLEKMDSKKWMEKWETCIKEIIQTKSLK